MISRDPNSITAHLLALNNAQRGSFGEFIFAAVAANAKGWRVVRQHRQRVDFLVNSIGVDVKTSVRGLKRPAGLVLNFAGTRVDGVSYAMVEFVPDGARVSLEAAVLGDLSWDDVQQLWIEWKDQGRHRKGGGAPNPNAEVLRALRTELTAFFQSVGLRPRILYRTCQAEFGREAPANLRPSAHQADRVTVYLDFRDQRIDRDNIRRIVAFPDGRNEELPKLAKTRLHLAKVDLERLPPEFLFAGIDDLKARFVAERFVERSV